MPQPLKSPRKAIALMSGGLDSTLAARLVKDQGVQVTGLHLLSSFGCREDVQRNADAIDVPLIIKPKGEAYLDLLENPRYGYGRHMNPCIDCRIFMFQLADVVRQDLGADFIVTGEVMGQRPMSQQKHSLSVIDKQSALDGIVVRPLSAHCFEPTIPEQEGWVDRNSFLSIVGRGRKEQLALAKKLGITEYGSPGGGCLLTEAAFSERLRDFFAHKTYQSSEERMAQTELLRVGRHFRFSESAKVIVARNDKENQDIASRWKTANGVFFWPENFDGPNAIAFGVLGDEERSLVGAIIARYGKASVVAEKTIAFESLQSGPGQFHISQPATEEQILRYRIGTGSAP